MEGVTGAPTFLELCAPFVSKGVRCFPLALGTKIPLKGLDWKARAACDPDGLRKLSEEYPGPMNCALLSEGKAGGLCALEFDIPGAAKRMAQECGESTPDTLIQWSPGHRAHQLFFTHTTRSLALGNRQALWRSRA